MANEWSDEELRISVAAYLDMLSKYRDGQPFVKKAVYRELVDQFGRTEKSFEYRMQNISFVLSMMGRDWLPGLVPAKNVGTSIAAKIEQFIGDLEDSISLPRVAESIKVRETLQRPAASRPEGTKSPAATTTSVTTYARDPEVRAWVLRRALAKCECCLQAAPFIGTDDLPFLEVHHVRQLADSGSDHVTNAVALCPNCHRLLHYGKHRKEALERLFQNVLELVPE